MAAAIPNGYMPTYTPKTTATPTTGVSASQAQMPPVMTPAQMQALQAGAAAGMAQYQATGSFTDKTPAQNLAAVINQPGNTVAQNPTPYIQSVLGQAASDTVAQSAPQGVPQGSPMPSSQGQTPPSSGGIAPPKFDAAGIAASRVAAQRAALAGSVSAYDASRKQNYDYTTQNTQDQRTLDNSMFKETNNPFSGKYQYDTTNILRNNGIADTQSQMSYNNDIAAENQKLADFDAGAPGMTQDIQSQLEQQQFTNGLATNQDNRAQQGQDFTQGLQTNQNNFNQNLQTNQQALSAQNQQFSQNQQLNEFAYKQARDSIGDEQYKAKFDQDVQQQGFENALKIAVQNHQISNDQAQLAISQQNANISQQNANTSSKNAANSQSNTQQDNLMNIWKATGKAPAGINGVTEGTAYTGTAADKADPNAVQSTYVAGLDSLTPEKRVEVFKSEKQAMIKDLGIGGYNSLYSLYFDANGNPK